MLYPGCEALTWKDVKEIDAQNEENSWGISDVELFDLEKQHKAARENGDILTMEKIEYRLTDCNFHTACKQLHNGWYQKFENTYSKHTYYWCTKDKEENLTGMIEKVELTEMDYKFMRVFQFVFETYGEAAAFLNK